MARAAQLTDQEYAQRLGGRSNVVATLALDDTRVDGNAEFNKALIKVQNFLKKNGIEFVQHSASNKHSVVLTRFGVAIGTIDAHDQRIVIGKLENYGSTAPKWQITEVKFFDVEDSLAILRHVVTSEKPVKESVKPSFKALVQRMKDVGVLGTETGLKFTTKMGLIIGLRTVWAGQTGIWATIEFKNGQVMNRTIGEGELDDVDQNHMAFVANIVRKGELEELGWSGRRKDVHYAECGHRSAPKTRVREHNCGCTETTTVHVKKGKSN